MLSRIHAASRSALAEKLIFPTRTNRMVNVDSSHITASLVLSQDAVVPVVGGDG